MKQDSIHIKRYVAASGTKEHARALAKRRTRKKHLRSVKDGLIDTTITEYHTGSNQSRIARQLTRTPQPRDMIDMMVVEMAPN